MKYAAVFLVLAPVLANAQFALKGGDRVVFYGDSITDQRLYTLYTEAFVRTRFPKLKVTFVHSGWGGDRVTGGGGGDIDTRLTRDVLAFHPSVVTIMLAMNDAGYRPFDQGLYDTYSKGYRHIVDRLKQEDPGVRLTLIVPSPFDDVTRAPSFEGGYNAVLLRYGDFVKDLASQSGSTVADFNSPMVAMLKAADAKNPSLAQKLIPDRVHPGVAGHLVMAEALLESWKAPSVVSSVDIEDGKVSQSEDTKITDLKAGPTALSWTQLDAGLPYPLDLTDASVQLVTDSSDFISALDQQILKVSGLQGRQTLSIDGKVVGTFGADELAAGINLATMDTPMKAQASRVFDLVRERSEAHNDRWRVFQTGWPFANETAAAKEKDDVLKALDRYDQALDQAAMRAAQPTPHRFTLTPAAG